MAWAIVAAPHTSGGAQVRDGSARRALPAGIRVDNHTGGPITRVRTQRLGKHGVIHIGGRLAEVCATTRATTRERLCGWSFLIVPRSTPTSPLPSVCGDQPTVAEIEGPTPEQQREP